MHSDCRPGATTITGDSYLLELRSDPPRAILADRSGRIWSHLSLLASLNRTDGTDECYATDERDGAGGPIVRERGPDAIEVTVELRSPIWEHKQVRLLCRPDAVEVSATVCGHGDLAEIQLLGGRAVLSTGASGAFRSSIDYQSVFDPTPTEPVQIVRPASAAVTLGVVGDAEPGRLHAVFSPPPLCLALGRSAPAGATDIPAGDWLSLAVRAPVHQLGFTELRYAPVDGGFWLELDYDGHTQVAGEFTAPTVVIRPADNPFAAIGRHREDLVQHGLAAAAPLHQRADWWSEPIFCGWGAQCARAPLPGEPASHPYYLADLRPAVLAPGQPVAAEMARMDVYDDLLGTLAKHHLVPGTVVIDDQWQAQYGTAEPDRQRWPDLRAWIDERHRTGQRVLLWWKAWDPAGIPAAECVLDPWGRPVSADPGNPGYRQRLTAIVTSIIGPDGLDADGLKIDFSQRAPAGPSLRSYRHPDGSPGSWGIAALHDLLQTIYLAAKAAKPDALIITHTPHPSFGDVCDMVRLNDVLERDPATNRVPVADQLRFRHAVVTAAMPNHLVDTDQWPMPDKEQWRSYVSAQAGLGVPALYYAERIDRSTESLNSDDLALVAQSWRRYRERMQREGTQ